MNRFITFLTCLMISLSLFNCKEKSHPEYTSPPGYDLTKPYQFKLPLELDEISGVAYYTKDSSVFAINDEKGLLYKIRVGDKKQVSWWKFSDGADFEDLTLVDSTFYVLQSNGTIIRIKFDPAGRVAIKTFPFSYGKGNEFEILYWDESKKKLILMCKDCDADKKSALTTYSFDPVSYQFSDSSFSIDVKMIAGSLNVKKFRFKPSAAAINPVDSSLYIISAINKMLVVTDRDGHFKKAYPVNHALFKQPEGITFTPWGTIIISNESAGVGVADILIFSKK
jgi:uncharacterized protein YjiK